ncbi:hypothetical protein GJ496_003239 [Pomphorhynchus laevis]|nr:hypothetical protein GJ496_003239 [Pomphorhynchus laevis]
MDKRSNIYKKDAQIASKYVSKEETRATAGFETIACPESKIKQGSTEADHKHASFPKHILIPATQNTYKSDFDDDILFTQDHTRQITGSVKQPGQHTLKHGQLTFKKGPQGFKQDQQPLQQIQQAFKQVKQASQQGQQASQQCYQSSRQGRQLLHHGQQAVQQGQQSSSHGQQHSHHGQQAVQQGQQASQQGQQHSHHGQQHSHHGKQFSKQGQHLPHHGQQALQDSQQQHLHGQPQHGQQQNSQHDQQQQGQHERKRTHSFNIIDDSSPTMLLTNQEPTSKSANTTSGMVSDIETNVHFHEHRECPPSLKPESTEYDRLAKLATTYTLRNPLQFLYPPTHDQPQRALSESSKKHRNHHSMDHKPSSSIDVLTRRHLNQEPNQHHQQQRYTSGPDKLMPQLEQQLQASSTQQDHHQQRHQYNRHHRNRQDLKDLIDIERQFGLNLSTQDHDEYHTHRRRSHHYCQQHQHGLSTTHSLAASSETDQPLQLRYQQPPSPNHMRQQLSTSQSNISSIGRNKSSMTASEVRIRAVRAYNARARQIFNDVQHYPISLINKELRTTAYPSLRKQTLEKVRSIRLRMGNSIIDSTTHLRSTDPNRSMELSPPAGLCDTVLRAQSDSVEDKPKQKRHRKLRAVSKEGKTNCYTISTRRRSSNQTIAPTTNDAVLQSSIEITKVDESSGTSIPKSMLTHGDTHPSIKAVQGKSESMKQYGEHTLAEGQTTTTFRKRTYSEIISDEDADNDNENDHDYSPPTLNTVTTHLQTRKTSCVSSHATVKSASSKSASKSRRHSKTESQSKSSDSQFVCPCTQPLLPGEFFVVCNTCGQSSHGICVGIAFQGNLREAYVCAKCTKAESNSHLYCICRQPYDEEQFYVGCDSCQNWFHGSCVNVTPEQAEEMKKYFCDKCRDDKQSVMDVKLTVKQTKLISKLVKDLKQHKLAWPFREPVNPVQYPHYYQIITNPMDLSGLKDNVDKGKYHSLSEFVNDTTKIFDNCRVFNNVDSIFWQCADGLENYFVELLNKLKRKIVAERHRRESRDVLSELAGESSNNGGGANKIKPDEDEP